MVVSDAEGSRVEVERRDRPASASPRVSRAIVVQSAESHPLRGASVREARAMIVLSLRGAGWTFEDIAIVMRACTKTVHFDSRYPLPGRTISRDGDPDASR